MATLILGTSQLARPPAFKYILLQKSPIKIAPNLRHFPITATLCIAEEETQSPVSLSQIERDTGYTVTVAYTQV